ncbi:hypothetical protein [Pandoraea sputorum]|uniref:hypothetical protein n=1 Tax=Pandoraea sputorum TaxID=93222 RepID=UPI002AF6A076|nr:hypothetical protein [Pandoraea sputorum]
MSDIVLMENKGSLRQVHLQVALAMMAVTLPGMGQATTDEPAHQSSITTYRAMWNSPTSGSESVIRQASGDSRLNDAVKVVMADLIARQQPLGQEFEEVLFANLASFYVED